MVDDEREPESITFSAPACELCGHAVQEATLTAFPGFGGYLIIHCPGCGTERCDVVSEQDVELIVQLAKPSKAAP